MGNGPAIVELEPGTYYSCTCGGSKTAPLCDGSHKGTDKTPIEFSITEKKTVALCQCGKSKNQPFCDGSHESGGT